MKNRLLFLALASAGTVSTFAVDPDALAVVTTCTAAFGTVAVLSIAVLGFRKIVKLVKQLI